MKERTQKAKNDLLRQGYVVDLATLRPVGEIIRIWGRYEAPTKFYLQVSNIDQISIFAGQLGIADIKVGHPEFDSEFVVRSNAPQLVSQALPEELRTILLKHQNIRFRTGSIDSLLGADYFTEQTENRDARNFWMLEKAGVFNAEETAKLYKLALELSTRVKLLGATLDTNTKTSFFEGR